MMINPYNSRQLDLMELHIKKFRKYEIDLAYLIENLIALRDALEIADDKWEHNFTHYLTDLASVYSYRLEHEVNKERYEEVVENALKNLISLIKNFSLSP